MYYKVDAQVTLNVQTIVDGDCVPLAEGETRRQSLDAMAFQQIKDGHFTVVTTDHVALNGMKETLALADGGAILKAWCRGKAAKAAEAGTETAEVVCTLCPHKGREGGPSPIMICTHPYWKQFDCYAGCVIKWVDGKQVSRRCPMLMVAESSAPEARHTCGNCGLAAQEDSRGDLTPSGSVWCREYCSFSSEGQCCLDWRPPGQGPPEDQSFGEKFLRMQAAQKRLAKGLKPV